MLISDSHEFIFVQMRKVASTSMQAVLRPLCLPPPSGRLAHFKSRARLEWNYQKHLFRTHDDILAARRRMPTAVFERYFKFAFVRNPWERLVSEYHYILSRPEHGRHARVSELADLRGFIRMQIPRRDAYQLNMLCDRRGTLLMDFVGKLESLQADWETVGSAIGIPHQPLPRRNETSYGRYQDFYDQAGIDLVAKHWAVEIERFGYSFDS